MQSNTTSDLDIIWSNDKSTIKHQIQGSQEVSPFLGDDYKAERNRQDNDTKHNPLKKHHLGMVSMKLLEGLNMFAGTMLQCNAIITTKQKKQENNSPKRNQNITSLI